ncbi:MAG: D-alanyl-D-alanine-carboxypeptidase/D-alanyl-D-alanine-endopeptidase [Myxococcota bacterium]|jgi:D-alanyl-D-alanine-carboxypeptidase/D-alanyl-D-alanine-endopeptidase
MSARAVRRLPRAATSAEMRLAKLLLFLVAALAVHGGLWWAYHVTILPAHRMSEVDAEFLASDAPLDVLVVGDSHPMNAVHPAALGPHAASIAVAGEHVVKTAFRLPDLLDESGREVKTVVLPFDPSIFSTRFASRFEPEHVWAQHVPLWELGLRRQEPVAYGQRWAKAWLVPYAGELATWYQWSRGKRAFQDEDDPARFADRPPPSERRTPAETAADHMEGADPLDPGAIWAFRSLLTELRRRDIRVVLVAYPLHPAYSAEVDRTGFRDAVRRTVLAPLLERHDHAFLDFEGVFHDRPELFYDGDHVNAQGRKELSLELAEALISLGALPEGYPIGPGEAPQYDWRRLERAVRELLRDNSLPGAAIIVQQHGVRVLERAWGKYTTDTPIAAGSASKWISAATWLTLWDDGRIELDQPISDHVPSFDRPDKRGITYRQAMSHQSGLMARHPVVNDYAITLADAVDHIATTDLLEPPGVAFRYGALGYHAAARGAEVVTGDRWTELFEARMAQPLGFTHTRYGFTGYSDNPGIAGNLVTTAEDFVHFLQLLLDDGMYGGERLLSVEAIHEMERGQTRGLPREGHVPIRHINSKHDLYGLGVWRDTVSREGELLVSSAPGKFGFTPWIDRRHGIAAVMALQVGGPKPIDKIPDPGGLEYLVCDILDQATRRPILKTAFNPKCRRR